MAQISPELQRRIRFMSGSIPAAVGDDERTDRLLMADDLIRKSQAAATPAERKRLGEQAHRVLTARPRAETEAIVVAKMAKVKALGNSPQAADLARQAREELDLNPPAVRRTPGGAVPVTKASVSASSDQDPVIVLYDRAGNPAYAIDPDSPDLMPLTTSDAIAKARPGKGGREAGRR